MLAPPPCSLALFEKTPLALAKNHFKIAFSLRDRTRRPWRKAFRAVSAASALVLQRSFRYSLPRYSVDNSTVFGTTSTLQGLGPISLVARH
eukprot:6202590-Pleurochrysis_carterae.AAC.8